MCTTTRISRYIRQYSLASLCVLLAACIPVGQWMPVPKNELTLESSLRTNDTAAILGNLLSLSIRGQWIEAEGSVFHIRVKSSSALPLQLDLKKTLFMIQEPVALREDYGVDLVARATNDKEDDFITMFGPASEHFASRIEGEESPAGISPEELLTVDAGGSAVFELLFKVIPPKDRTSYAVVRVAFNAEGRNEVAKVQFRARR